MPSKSEELRLIADAMLRLSGVANLADGEGFFIVTQGKRCIIARGMVSEYRSEMRHGGDDEFTLKMVGATITHEDV